MIEVSWQALLCQYWTCHWMKGKEDVEIATAELRNRFQRNAPSNMELCDALRYMAGPEGQTKCPTLRDIVRTIYTLRKGTQAQESADTIPPCYMCRSLGWMEVYPEADEHIDLATAHTEYVQAVPCCCTRGERALANAKQYDQITSEGRAKIERLQKLARAQQVRLESQMDEWIREQGYAAV